MEPPLQRRRVELDPVPPEDSLRAKVEDPPSGSK